MNVLPGIPILTFYDSEILLLKNITILVVEAVEEEMTGVITSVVIQAILTPHDSNAINTIRYSRYYLYYF